MTKMRHLQTYRLFESAQTLTQDQKDFLDKYTKGGPWSLNPSTGLVDVDGDFYCSREGLNDLLGIRFGKAHWNFYCNGNNLTSLEGAPETVGGEFSCYNNRLTSLAGAPETVKGEFSSDGLKIPEGKWSMDTLIKIFLNGTPNQQQLVAPLVDPKVIQQQIDENPEGMLIKLKGYLKHPQFQELKWPQHLDQEKDLLSDLGDVGL